MSEDVELKIMAGRPVRGKHPVTLSRGNDVLLAREVNPHQSETIDAFLRDAKKLLPGLNGQAEDLRRELLQLAKPPAPKLATAPNAASSAQSNEFRATELANAEEVYRQHKGKFVYDLGRGKFRVVDGGIWPSDETGEVARWIKQAARTTSNRLSVSQIDPKNIARHVTRMESAAGVAGVRELLKTEPGISMLSTQFDTHPLLLPFANGTFNFETCRLTPHDPAHYFTRKLGHNYDPIARCPAFMRFLDRIMAGNKGMIAYLCRIAGLSLTGASNVQELYIFHGNGANGKSTFCDLFLWLLGEFAGVAPDSLLVARQHGQEHPTELAQLKGKRLIVSSESEAGGKMRLQLVKRLTGDMTIVGRHMRQDFIEFNRTHKMWHMTNNKPVIPEQTDAAWRRIRLIPFNVVIPEAERDINLLEKLKLEAKGILAWAVRGCIDWRKNGMIPPTEVIDATKEYHDESDPLEDFISERCITGDVTCFRVSRADLLACYFAWAKAAKDPRPLTRNELYGAVRQHPGVVVDEWKIDGEKVRGFTGIGICRASDDTPKGGSQ